MMTAPALATPDTGLGPTGTSLVSTYGGVPLRPLYPQLQSITPNTFRVNVPTFVTLRGTGFGQGLVPQSAVLDFSDIVAVSDTVITATAIVAPAFSGGLGGSGLVSLYNPTGADSNAVAVSFTGGPAPLTSPVVNNPPPTPQGPTVTTLPPTIGSPMVSGPVVTSPPSAVNLDRPASGGGGTAASATGAPVSTAPAPDLRTAAPVSTTPGAPTTAGKPFPWWWLLVALLVLYYITRNRGGK